MSDFIVTWKMSSVSLPIGITWTDYPSKDDCAVIVYFCGCEHNCPGCQNPELQKFGNGSFFMYNELADMIKAAAERAHTNKVVFSGGDPFFQPQVDMEMLIYELNNSGYKICIYTGADIKDIMAKFPRATYYKCGKYDERNKEKEWGKFSDKMVFVSKNQALYNSEGKQISVDNVYYFSKWDTFKAKIKKWFKVNES